MIKLKTLLESINSSDVAYMKAVSEYTSAAHHGSPDLNPVRKDGRFKTKGERFFGKKDDEDAYFFTDSRRVAHSYSDEHRAFDYQSADGGVMNVFLNLGKSKEVDGKGVQWKHRTRQSVTQAKREGYDSYTVSNTRDEYHPGKLRATVYAVFDANQIKLADAVTKDADGNIVPLSNRFDHHSDDIRTEDVD
jgi:hypothetical protein